MPHPPPTAGIFAGLLPAPFLLLLSVCAGAAVSGLARSPCHASRICPCRTARLSPVLDTGHPRPRRQLSRNPSGTTGGGVWHRDSHPGATTQMILCLRRILTVDATADVIGHRYHRCLWRYSSESPWMLITRGRPRPHPQPTAGTSYSYPVGIAPTPTLWGWRPRRGDRTWRVRGRGGEDARGGESARPSRHPR